MGNVATPASIKKSLFRTIAALKQECDVYEKLYHEEQEKCKRL